MKFIRVTCVLLLTCFCINAFSQSKTITGTITDATDGSPMPGVNVIVKGTTRGTLTGGDGTYSISAAEGEVLTYSFIGYSTQEITVGNTPVLDVALQVAVTGLEEIVVIGYGTVRKEDATGSVAVVSSKDFNNGAITSPQDLIVGKSAGVVITSGNGAPGSGVTIRIRGGSSLKASNDPLLIVDGIPLSNNSVNGMSNGLASINPNDIETFTVLKDASATAIYGSRASNGVIIITTKKGRAGQPFKVNYSGIASVSTPIEQVELLSGDELRSLAQERIGKNNINQMAIDRLGTANTDWQSEIYQNALSQDHNVSVSGSKGKSLYRASLGYTDQEGILENTGLKRTTISLGYDPMLLDDHLKVSVNAKGSLTDNNFGNTGAVGAAVNFDPTQPVRNDNTRYGGYYTWTLNKVASLPGGPNDPYNQMATSNPVAMNALTDNTSRVYRGLASAQFDYKFHFLPDLRANLNLGYDIVSSKGHNNADTIAVWTRRAGYGQLTDYNQENRNSLLDFYFNYTRDLTPILSRIEVTAGYSWQHFYREGDNYQRSIVTPQFPLVVADSSAFKSENYLVSFFGRLNYTFMERYLFTFTLRNDGSSRFSEENRWGLFPSLAFAWKINDEPFLRDIRQITDLKLRAGWGKTGQQDIVNNDYPYMGTYRISDQTSQYQFGNRWLRTLRPNAYDPHIKWETTTTINAGIDLGLLNDRITATFDYYQRTTTDLINEIPIPNGSNFSNYLTTNVGTLENTGYEISLNFRPISRRDMSWTIGTNLTYNENKITKLLRTDDPTYPGVPWGGIGGGTGNNIQMNSTGYPSYSFFVLQQIYDEKGMPVEGKYENRSGQTGSISGNLKNYYHYKKSAPDYLIGISSRFEYRGFDFAFSGRLSLGNYVYNNVASQTFYGNLYNNNFWQNLTKHIDKTQFSNAQYFSDFYVEDASYFKMDNLSVGYNFNKMFTEKLKGRVSFTVQNAFIITSYTGLDPEVENGIDNNIYPRPRVFLLGLNLDF